MKKRFGIKNYSLCGRLFVTINSMNVIKLADELLERTAIAVPFETKKLIKFTVQYGY